MRRMKYTRHKRLILFLGAMLFLILRGSAQIQGGVFNQKGEGIPNAIIIATDSVRKSIDTAWSDKRGFYIFRVLKLGKYKIEAKAPCFNPSVYENVEVNEEESSENTGKNDESFATRLEIILKPAKVPK